MPVLSRAEGPARVLFATELWFPPNGFLPPHRLALVEREEGGRVLAIVDGALPGPGDAGTLRPDLEGRPHWTASSGDAPTS